MSTLFNGMNMALRTLLANQEALLVTEHNVANANTPGYHRQEAVLTAGYPFPEPGFFSASLRNGQLGTGVDVAAVRRFQNTLVEAPYRRELGEQSYWNLREAALKQVESLMAENGTDSLQVKLDEFWDGWQTLSSDPTNTALRTELLARAGGLVESFHSRADQLRRLQVEVDASIPGLVQEINQSAAQLAQLNGEITRVVSAGGNPNDLLDTRDRLLERLAQIGGATANVQPDDTVTVSLGGHALVVGTEPFALQTAPQPGNALLHQVSWADAKPLQVERGELAALLETRDEVIPGQQEGLDALASALAERINEVHRGGYGLDGSHGLNFFSGAIVDSATGVQVFDATNIHLDPAISDPVHLAAAGQPNAPGDGSQAQNLAAVGLEALGLGGKATLNEAVRLQALDLGIQINQAGEAGRARQVVLAALDAQRQSEAGVSLDEEAANLVKYQRSYQAAARMMTVLDEMANTIINGMGSR